MLKGIRGAITVAENTAGEILSATEELLLAMIRENSIQPEDVAAVFFTATPDLNAAFPAAAARKLGWDEVPLLCHTEIDVPGALPRVIRVLVLLNVDDPTRRMRPVYLREAVSLRPDIPAVPPVHG